MATAKKKKSVGQVAYLTKQVASLEKDLVRKDIEKLDQKVDGVKTELSNKIEKLDQKVDGVKTELITKVGNVKTELIAKIDKVDVKIDNVKTELKKDIKWLKWILGGGLSALLVIMLYLHGDNKQDMKELKQDMKELKQDINSRFDKIERAIESINQKLK